MLHTYVYRKPGFSSMPLIPTYSDQSPPILKKISQTLDAFKKNISVLSIGLIFLTISETISDQNMLDKYFGVFVFGAFVFWGFCLLGLLSPGLLSLGAFVSCGFCFWGFCLWGFRPAFIQMVRNSLSLHVSQISIKFPPYMHVKFQSCNMFQILNKYYFSLQFFQL